MQFDVDGLVRDLDTLAPPWTSHFVPWHYDGDWSAFPLRAPAGETHPIRMIFAGMNDATWIDTPALAAAPAIRAVLDQFRCPLRSVRLMRLTPGSTIKEHSDPDLRAEAGDARLHVPITTDPAVEFLLNRTPVTMLPGTLWYLRLSDPHSAVNRSDRDRVHLVIDATVNDWLRELLDAGVAQQAHAEA